MNADLRIVVGLYRSKSSTLDKQTPLVGFFNQEKKKNMREKDFRDFPSF